MKILYGVQGTGNGHISRARAMAKAFKDMPEVDVDFLFSGRPPEKYFDMDVFGDYQTRTGLSFVSHAGKVSIARTAIYNKPWKLLKEIRELDVSSYDLVISDFEPVTAWAAKKQNVPSLAVSHQAAFSFDVPKRGEGFLDTQIMRFFAPTEHKIGLHWYHFDHPILPPIVDLSHDAIPQEEDFILVYLPFEDLNEVVKLLKQFDTEFICFHPDAKTQAVHNNVTVRPQCKEGFHDALLRCKGVMANGGFELPSEALTIGKKLLLKPLTGQFEQQSNVATLEMLGMATCMEELNANTIHQWLDAPKAQAIDYPDVAPAIAKWLVSGDLNELPALQKELWQQVVFPEHVTDLLSDFRDWSQVRSSSFLTSRRERKSTSDAQPDKATQ
ncbi:glycosyltransferase [Veronia nyctiphanis]|uniref:Glycosyltransferase n=1 Tax=Veronia nyctiphanis TaxID=1278244 RepID=A0A4Q0YQC8_9GAMM|nr:MJ1255/VC2487 family glycosyltransferase [Veronia nyctiphanis]RXJ73307.1 glycosyltransferase [Veronia nyctiphanis]